MALSMWQELWEQHRSDHEIPGYMMHSAAVFNEENFEEVVLFCSFQSSRWLTQHYNTMLTSIIYIIYFVSRKSFYKKPNQKKPTSL